MPHKSFVIGVYGFVFLETLHRRVLGMLRYCNEVGGLEVRDFRTQSTGDGLETLTQPLTGLLKNHVFW